MDKVFTRKRKILILNIFLFSVLFILFRVFLGEYILDKFESIETNAFSFSQTGQTLTEIPKSSLATNFGDSRSTLISDFNFKTLNGNTGVQTTDPRSLAMRKFLLDYNSPMYPYADIFISEANRYGLDWRLVASISGVESAFGNLIPPRSNNGWGWRGGPGGAYSIFPTWKEGIQTITRGLALGYGTNVTPFQIEVRYCPPCYANPYHAWANGVTKFMNELDYYYANLEKI